ncbi:MAG: hypothetical protein ACOCQD_03220 [archaeon]
METVVDGIGHIKKLMNYGLPKNAIEVNESYLNNINYYRDWWSDVVLYRQKHTDKVVAFKNIENGKLYIEDK